MTRKHKVGRNDACPCGTGKKYKNCCDGHVDWNAVLRTGGDWIPYLSNRGRNIYLANKIFDVLALESTPQQLSIQEYKDAFTASAVRKIHEAVLEVWPPNMDIKSALARCKSDVSGLYIGDYHPEYLSRAVVRHSIYANKILLVEPFVYPPSVVEKYNPLENPEQYRAQTLRNVNFVISLLPWIDAGIVEMIRTPADFDPKFNWEAMLRQERKFDENEELQGAVAKSVSEMSERHIERESFRHMLLSAPDEYIRRLCRKLDFENSEVSEYQFITYINNLRENDIDFLEPMGSGKDSAQLHMMSTGVNYEVARVTSGITNSYLVTDIASKWKEIEFDREEHTPENVTWAPFAKSVQETKFRYLNNVKLTHALKLRQEGRLENLRNFMHRIWKEASSEKPFDAVNAESLARELSEEVRNAEVEWREMNRDLVKIVGAGTTTGLLAAGPLIAFGHGEFLAAAAAVSGGTTLVSHNMKKRSFPDRFPAAFFMNIDRK